MVPSLGYLGEFPKTRGTGTLYKDPTFEETILGSPIFGIASLGKVLYSKSLAE